MCSRESKILTRQSAETLYDEAPNHGQHSQSDYCGGSGYRTDCRKRAFELPMPTPL